MGLVDMALVNSYIVHKEYRKRHGKKSITRDEFLTELQAQLVGLSVEDFGAFKASSRSPTPSPYRPAQPQRDDDGVPHVPKETTDMLAVKTTGQTKRRQRACKVCSIWRDDTATAANGKPKRGKNTKWLCRPYSKGEAK